MSNYCVPCCTSCLLVLAECRRLVRVSKGLRCIIVSTERDIALSSDVVQDSTVFVLKVSDERTAGRGWGGVFLVFSFFFFNCGFSFQIKINLYWPHTGYSTCCSLHIYSSTLWFPILFEHWLSSTGYPDLVILKSSYPDQIDPIRCCFKKLAPKVSWITWSRIAKKDY